jgi:hypothetical protein
VWRQLCVMGRLVHTGLGSSSLVAHVLHHPPSPREQLCNRSCSNKHTAAAVSFNPESVFWHPNREGDKGGGGGAPQSRAFSPALPNPRTHHASFLLSPPPHPPLFSPLPPTPPLARLHQLRDPAAAAVPPLPPRSPVGNIHWL